MSVRLLASLISPRFQGIASELIFVLSVQPFGLISAGLPNRSHPDEIGVAFDLGQHVYHPLWFDRVADGHILVEFGWFLLSGINGFNSRTHRT
jgi:hypothetical protein